MTDYTSPAIRFADGTYMMDSWLIAHELEKQYPSPSLHLDDPIVVRIRDHIVKLAEPLSPQLHPKIPRRILNKESAEYFNRTREVRFGMPLEQLEREKATEQNWVDVKGPAEEVAELLKKNGGPFFLGDTGEFAIDG
jgi:glutathione S-transferase